MRIAEAGVEPFIGDPDRVGTLVPALQHVGVVWILLGSASGPQAQLEALHGPRLEMLLTKLIDTTVRAVVYESAGTVPAPVLSRGAELVGTAGDVSRIPYELLDADGSDRGRWLAAARAAAQGLGIDS